jgi:hypothetical protein
MHQNAALLKEPQLENVLPDAVNCIARHACHRHVSPLPEILEQLSLPGVRITAHPVGPGHGRPSIIDDQLSA